MLGFKRTLYEKERNILSQLRAQRLALEVRRDETQRQVLEKDAAFRQKAATEGARIDEVNSLNYHRDNADKLVKQLDGEMAELDVKIEAQLKIVMQLDQDVKGLEKLREKQLDEYNAAAMREEQERILELISGRFAEEQQAGGN